MNAHNLIPIGRKRLKCRQASVRRWMLINAAYAVVLTLVAVAYVATFAGPAPAGPGAEIATEIQRSLLKVASLRKQSATLAVSVGSITEAAGSPDWSAMLRALSDSLGDDMVLSDVDCGATHEGAVAASPQVLRIGGIGRSQNVVSAFVLSLEDLKLFDRVDLVQTAPRPLCGTDGVGFELQCALPTPTGSKR